MGMLCSHLCYVYDGVQPCAILTMCLPSCSGHGMAHEPAAADGLPDTARAVDMRRTYPAGRILHLVPASAAFVGTGETHCCSKSGGSPARQTAALHMEVQGQQQQVWVFC
jgi:hypothetical protein